MWTYFTDPVLRAPTLGCMLMCLAAALVGTIVFLRKQSLIGEALSHASYPGVILGILFAASFFNEANDQWIAFFILTGAFLTGFFGLKCIHHLNEKWKIRTDSALCLILSSFFGIGLTLASRVQFTHTTLYKQAQVYLYGQAATMTDFHVWIYGLLSLFIITMVLLIYKELQTMLFDRNYSISLGIPTHIIDTFIFILIVLAIVIGIRSVGVVLMSAMLIAPPAAARQYTNKLYKMFLLSSLFGILSGFLGNYLSVELGKYLTVHYPSSRIALPTGPMIVIAATAICVFSLLLAPERGLVVRVCRIARFRYKSLCENVMKTLWRYGEVQESVSFNQISHFQNISKIYLHLILWRLKRNGWVMEPKRDFYSLTTDGKLWGAKIVRLHRLWEVYLADYLGVGGERVHKNAEEMEHIITPDLERELTLLLKDPKRDPHHQLIPSVDVVIE